MALARARDSGQPLSCGSILPQPPHPCACANHRPTCSVWQVLLNLFQVTIYTLRFNPTEYSTAIMPHRNLDATDIRSNTARLCQPCRAMFRVRPKAPKFLETLRNLGATWRGYAFSKGSGYQHPQLLVTGNEDTKCELCIFLGVELGDGPDTPLPKNYGFIKAFALPGEQGPK